MPIIDHRDSDTQEVFPRVQRTDLMNARLGSLSLTIGDLTIDPGGRVPTHTHPNTEEAMVVVEGELEAVLEDQTTTVGPGDTVLAPAGTRHGFVNRSSVPARLIAAFPTTHVERVITD